MMLVRVVLAIVLMLGGCATQQKSIQSFDPAVLSRHLESVKPVAGWNIRGRLSLRTEKGGQIGRLRWARSVNRHQQIDLYGSLGSGHVRLVSQPNDAVLVDSEGEELIGTSAQMVLDEYIGWQFPVEELDSWVVGRPHPGAPAFKEWDTNGYIVLIEQSGWRVQISRYKQYGEYALPTRFRLIPTEAVETSSGTPNDRQPSEIRLVISSWSVN